ncbi:hypothetical protein WA026_022017 [Henosepilachna vigintioctopunctata]|uniref:RNA-binding S4 domain-containing protein n=1 Tax=Henosepilachna vigintioctopunctata TaxID=420089 RepID=A0AAW1V3P4_9CUCU
MLFRKLLCNYFWNNATIPFKDNTNVVLSTTLAEVNRFKSKNSITYQSSESSDTDNLDVDDKISKIRTINISNLRVDLILKSGLGIARNKIEKLFYENKIRVNGEKIEKKSVQVEEGDEIDVIKGPSPSNPQLLLVARVEVLKVKPVEENLSIKIRRSKSLLIEHYDKH